MTDEGVKPTLDEEETRKLSEKGIAQVDANADELWKECAYAAGVAAARKYSLFTADQIWEILDADRDAPPVHNRSAMGPIMRRLIKDKVMVAAGVFNKSIRPPNHGKALPVWQSLLRS